MIVASLWSSMQKLFHAPVCPVMSEADKRESASPLLGDVESTPKCSSEPLPQSPSAQSWRHNVCSHSTFLGLAYAVLCFLYLGLFYGWMPSSHHANNACANSHDLFPSIADSDAVHYERRPFPVRIHGNAFAGEPRPELDAAWHELFEDIRIRVSAADLMYFNLSSIPLANGSGFAAELGVHHELHCLKKIRHWIYRDYYLADEPESELVEWRAHIHHCLEMLRESIMCRGDTSLTTFQHLPTTPPRLTAVALAHHQCVDWDRLMQWVRARAVPIFEPGVLAE